MGTKQVRLDESVYERIEAHKRSDETFSEAVERLLADVSLLDLASDDDEYDAERAERRKATLDRTAEADGRAVQEMDDRDDP